jgi:integrase/recombinase XerD
MASLYKKPIVITDPRTGQKVKSWSRKWWGRYKNDDGSERRVPLAGDKKAALAMLNELVRKVELRLAGLESPFEEHLKRPLNEHLADFRQYLEGKGNTTKHASITCQRAQSILDGCKFGRLTDVSPSAVVEWLKVERAAGRLGIKSCNYYLASIKAFLGWMVSDVRTDRNPLAHLKGLNAQVDIRRERRCLEPQQFALFLEAARHGKPVRCIAGEHRRMLYILAAGSGLRCSELASLSPESFHLDGDSPCVVLQAAYSKRRRRDTQPLPRDVAALLAEWLQSRAAHQLLWPGAWVNHAAKMVRADLASARKAWIRAAASLEERKRREATTVLAYHDDQGRVFDFHSLRHQYISNLAIAGVHPKIAQTLARHSTITLTLDRYTHAGLADVAATVNGLPCAVPDVPEAERLALKATGTEGMGGAEVPTVVPRSAEIGAVLLSPKPLRIAPNCTEAVDYATLTDAATP